MNERPCVACGEPCHGERCRACYDLTRPRTQATLTCPDCGKSRPVSRSQLSFVRLGKRSGRCSDCARPHYTARRRRGTESLLGRGLKRCSLCEEIKPVAEFNRATHHWHGLASRCRDCDRGKASAYYRANREQALKVSAEWALANPEKRRQIARDHARRFRRAHPERARARKDRTDFDAILAEHGLVCHICGDPIDPADLHFDHVIPLSRGGAHDRTNIRPAHSRCNLRKGTKLMEELAA